MIIYNNEETTHFVNVIRNVILSASNVGNAKLWHQELIKVWNFIKHETPWLTWNKSNSAADDASVFCLCAGWQYLIVVCAVYIFTCGVCWWKYIILECYLSTQINNIIITIMYVFTSMMLLFCFGSSYKNCIRLFFWSWTFIFWFQTISNVEKEVLFLPTFCMISE